MSKVVCNIPHSNTIIPKWAQGDIIITQEELCSLIDFMTDKDIDKIWGFVPDKNKEVATLSRLILDIERFRNDKDENMATKGMGLYYTHTPAGKQFRVKSTESYNKCLSLYDNYHRSLEEKVKKCLVKHGKCVILDCHSFHDEMNYTDYETKDFPDVCIGINGKMSAEDQLVIDIFMSNGYSIKVNEPFAGSLVPLRYLNDEHVISIIIELNRRIYDNSSFEKVKNICREIFEKLNT